MKRLIGQCLREKDPSTYNRLELFWNKEKKRRFAHMTIETALRLLTIILVLAWLAFMLLHAVGYQWPQILGLEG
jgi:hypothetical protein